MNLVSIETAEEQLLVASGLTKLDGNSHNNPFHSLVLSTHLIPSNTRHNVLVDFRIRGQRRTVDLDGYWTSPKLHKLGY
jgi:hypothetical protein